MGRQAAGLSSEPQVTFASGGTPDVRLLHYNDVYHVDGASAEPVGGFARFMTLVAEYRAVPQLPTPLVLFSGDAFNPSLESSVTKGRHMVPVLNSIGTDCACVGNHNLDFGVEQFRHLAQKCRFPWLLANVLDPALGADVPLGQAKRTHMLTTGNGIRVSLIGLAEREWLATINSLPPNLVYRSATATAKELVSQLRQQGAQLVVCLSHMREPNDIKLAEQTDGIDIILGGHDHYYGHRLVNGTHVLRSSTDFKQMSYIEARASVERAGRWDFDIWCRQVTSDVPEHEASAELARHLTSKLHRSSSRPIGWSAMPLDARFSTVRAKESNVGNYVCDVMRRYHHAECAIMAAGTIRGDQIYPPGAIHLKDVVTYFPFEDPLVLLRAKGQAIRAALENGVSMYPALDGRFPQVSNIEYEFDPRRGSGSRLTSLAIDGQEVDPERKYLLATRGYMGRGKDGYASLLVQSEGGDVEEVIDEEHGILVSTMLRQYFMGLRTVGKWKMLSAHWVGVAEDARVPLSSSRKRGHGAVDAELAAEECQRPATEASQGATGMTWRRFLRQRLGLDQLPMDEEDKDDDYDHATVGRGGARGHGEAGGGGVDIDILLMRKFWARWALKAGFETSVCDALKEGEFTVDWTRVIAPRTDGRIRLVTDGGRG